MATATESGIFVAVTDVLKANQASAGGQLWQLKEENIGLTVQSPYIEYTPSPDTPVGYVSGEDLNGFISINLWVPKGHGVNDSLKQGDIIKGLFPRGSALTALNSVTGNPFTIHIGRGDIEPQRRGSGSRDKWRYNNVNIRYQALSCHN